MIYKGTNKLVGIRWILESSIRKQHAAISACKHWLLLPPNHRDAQHTNKNYCPNGWLKRKAFDSFDVGIELSSKSIRQ